MMRSGKHQTTMQRHGVTALALLGIFATSCASTPPLSDTALCDQLNAWVQTVAPGRTSTVKLVRGGTWMVDHYKRCEPAEGDSAAGNLCRWLMENTSTEFMEANINITMACLQGQRISGYVGNTGIESWSGKASFYSSNLVAGDVTIQLEYALDNSGESREDFLEITASAD